MKDEFSAREMAILRYIISLYNGMTAENMMNISFVTLTEGGSIDDTTAMEHIDAFEEWRSGNNYTVGQFRKYQNVLYKCLQAHTSQEGWEPDVAVSLWKKAGDPTEEWPEWSQPIGATDAYALGDKVSHNSKHWVSTADNNVWEPGVYGWSEQE